MFISPGHGRAPTGLPRSLSPAEGQGSLVPPSTLPSPMTYMKPMGKKIFLVHGLGLALLLRGQVEIISLSRMDEGRWPI